ncbi:hypothetical protein QAD02_023052 [Eretmocerus hayati]|uniref:Uncharacterized protein n=1 Tax=Eretmocerus hayati TaxID=131215 RepID=A0ACC2PVW1_9HYME|nr:hypothetical protein QAD02_023052 [Eretmocerus hayati]
MNIIHCAATHRSSAMAAKKLVYPAADRNKEPILSTLKSFMRPGDGQTFLEISSGSGQHMAHFAPHFPHIRFIPSEYDNRLLNSIRAWTQGLSNVSEPLLIDITKNFTSWPGNFHEKSIDYIYNANLIHISPWACTVGLFENASKLLKDDGVLITYGPYGNNGKIEPQSNIDFDNNLKQQNHEWGIRDLKDLNLLAKKGGMRLWETFDMPANNKTLVWWKDPPLDHY